MEEVLGWSIWNNGLFTVLGPVMLAATGFLVKRFFFDARSGDDKSKQKATDQNIDASPIATSSSSNSGNSINNTINLTLPDVHREAASQMKAESNNATFDIRKLESIKREVKILFIDDNYFKIVEILKKSGWSNVKLINELESFNQKEVMEANIIFVDIQGVGESLGYSRDGGLGLASVFKSDDKYKDKKIILYSAEQSGNIFNETIRKVDATLKKDATVYEFEKLIEDFSMEIFGNV
ncbi:response regulator [Citrobacter freundii]|nr:response regulator [Citrobacter freundii]